MLSKVHGIRFWNERHLAVKSYGDDDDRLLTTVGVAMTIKHNKFVNIIIHIIWVIGIV